MTYRLLPYTKIDGIRTVTDSGIKSLFNRTVEDGLDKIVLYDGTVQTPEAFLNMAKAPGTYFYLGYRDKELIGYVWLNRFENKTARYHFCAFKEYWGQLAEIAEFAMTTLLSMKDNTGAYVFDLFTGYVPVWNQAAIKFTLKHGGYSAGEIPNAIYNAETQKSEPAEFIYYTRGEK